MKRLLLIVLWIASLSVAYFTGLNTGCRVIRDDIQKFEHVAIESHRLANDCIKVVDNYLGGAR